MNKSSATKSSATKSSATKSSATKSSATKSSATKSNATKAGPRGAPERSPPSFERELAAIGSGRGPVAGIDEAGRGPWAGPVVAAAVILVPGAIPPGLDDSKALEAARREELYELLKASGAAIGIGIADVQRIDDMNILNATLWAMQRAVEALPSMPRLALVDGNRSPRLACATVAIVGGDATCVSIAAASIVAKVTRDRLMVDLARQRPGYGFERHKGYGTPEHKAALSLLGVTPHHRRSFRPVRLELERAAGGPPDDPFDITDAAP